MTIAWPMAIGACLTMAFIHLRIGLRTAPRVAHLLFSLNAFVTAVYACFELALACAESPAQYLALLRWLDIVGAAQMVSLTAFVWVYFGTGRKWLALLVPGLTCVGLIADLLPQPKLVYLHLTDIKIIHTFGGATYTVGEGVMNPWDSWFYLGLLLLVVFVVDASVTLWHRGARRRATLVGGTIIAFYLAGTAHAALVESGILRTPYLFSFGYLAILAAMGMELADDVSRSAQLAHDLRESEARMTLAAEAAGVGVWKWRIATNGVWGSDKWLSLFGFVPGEKVDFDKVLQRIHPDDRETVKGGILRTSQDRVNYVEEFRVILPDGSQRWIAARGQAEFGGDGKPILLRGASLDITQRKQAEQEAREKQRELAHLSRATLLGELGGSLAHELNQPLTAMVNNAAAGRRFIAKGRADLGKLDGLLEEVVADGRRAGEILRGIREMIRKGDEERAPLDLNAAVEEILRLVRSDALGRQCALVTEFDPALGPVNGNRVQLQQVFLNLILNALDAMDRTPLETRRVIVRTERQTDGQVRASVRDFGGGLPPEGPEQVFKPFFSMKRNGMGLGLAIARSIIEAHGGRIAAANAEGGGACFSFWLPAPPEARATEAASPQSKGDPAA
jgi:PAS domain S-box-containing protein